MKKLFIILLTLAVAGSFTMLSAQPDGGADAGADIPTESGWVDGVFVGNPDPAELEVEPDTSTAGLKLLIDFNLYQVAIENTFGYLPYRYGIDEETNALFEIDQNFIGASYGQPVLDNEGRFIYKQNRQRVFFTLANGTTPVGYDPLRPHAQTRNFDYRMEALRGSLSGDAADNTAAIQRIRGAIEMADRQVQNIRERLMSGQFPKDEFGAAVYTVTVEDMRLDNWVVELNSSADTVENRRYSYAMEVKSFKNMFPNVITQLQGRYYTNTDDFSRTMLVDGGTPKDGYYVPEGAEGGFAPAPRKYLGVRIHFPEHKYNAFAVIRAPYNFPVFDVAGKKLIIEYQAREGDFYNMNYQEGEAGAAPTGDETAGGLTRVGQIIANDQLIPTQNGVLHNVGQIKYIKARVSGRDFHNGFALRLRDQDQNVTEYFLGYLDFRGWRWVIWRNPNYIPVVSQREIFRIPLYPMERPYRVFDSFVVYRNGNDIGGDFVLYIWDVLVDYDLAISPDEYEAIDINDDYYWKVLRDAYIRRGQLEDAKFADRLELEKQEYARMRRIPRLLPQTGGSN